MAKQGRNETNRPCPIVVIGTGRSGTSLVSNILRRLGVFMGYTFVPANSANPHGHWEDIEFHELNHYRLNGFCSDEQWYEQLIPLIHRRQVHFSNFWGWKSPCTCELLVYYTQLLPQARWIQCIRNKEDVVKSCMRSYNWSKTQATMLHDTRIAAIKKYTNPYQIQFEELLASPTDVIHALAAFAKVDFNEGAVQLVENREMAGKDGNSIATNRTIGQKGSTIKVGHKGTKAPTKPRTTMKGQNA